MKRLIVLIVATIFIGAAPASADPGTNDPALHAAYVQRAQTEIIDTLFIGDSITKGWATSTVWPVYSSGGWPLYRSLRPAAFGISGDETSQILWRLQNGEMPVHTPRLFVVLGGVPDLYHGRTPQQTADGVMTVVDYIRAQAPLAHVVVIGTTPFLSSAYAELASQSNLFLCAAIENRCGTAAMKYKDFSGLFLRDDGTINSALLPDLVHPNNLAYLTWLVELLPVLWEMY